MAIDPNTKLRHEVYLTNQFNECQKPDKSWRVDTREEPQLRNANTITNRDTKQRF
jgi:hypothetical protein